MSPDLLVLRGQVSGQCRTMGLLVHAAELTAPPANAAGILRERLFRVRIAASAIHAAVLQASLELSGAEALLVLASIGTNALRLEKLTSAAIVVADKVIEDRHFAESP